MTFLTTFAVAAETSEKGGDLFSALGIDWRLLILQIIAFLILVALLGKFVYPWLMKSVDKRQEEIEAVAQAAEEAKEAAADGQRETAELINKARKEAAEIVSTAKLEASEMAMNSEKKAKSSAEKIVGDAQAQIQKDIEKAKKELHDETLELVALTTEKVVGKKLDAKGDEALIASFIKGSR